MTYTEQDHMQYLDEVQGTEGYGLLLSKGDPIAFNVSYQERERELQDEDDKAYQATMR